MDRADRNLIGRIDAFAAEETGRIGKERKLAVSFCRQMPPEILAGLGFHPARMLSGAGPVAEREGERLVRPDACPYCKTILGNFSLREGLAGKASIIAAVTTCDMMRRTLEMLGMRSGIPVFAAHSPSTISPNSRRFFSAQMRMLADKISSLTGEGFDTGMALDYFASRKKCAVQLHRLHLEEGVPLKILRRLAHLFNFSCPKRLSGLLDDISGRIKGSKTRCRIVLAGSALCFEDTAVEDFFEGRPEIGLVNLTCSGLDQFEGYLDAEPPAGSAEKTIAKFAEIALDGPRCIRSRPNSSVHERIGRYIGITGAGGLILKTLKFCDLWNSERQRMRETLGVHMLALDTDYSGSAGESLRTRLEAFAETICAPEGKSSRKNAGTRRRKDGRR